jgi:hypothetical protein
MPINKAVASGNGNRILTQKLHVQIANNPRSPQCQTEAELLSSSQPPNFSLPSTFRYISHYHDLSRSFWMIFHGTLLLTVSNFLVICFQRSL